MGIALIHSKGFCQNNINQGNLKEINGIMIAQIETSLPLGFV